MHFHLPKPLHGWRAFIGEVGIIVLGVLIALGAEQAVDDWHWNEKVAVVRKSMLRELANDRARWEEAMTQAPCASRDIEQLDRWAAGAPGAAAPRVSLRLDATMFWMHSANWNLATTSQTLDHFPIEEQLAFATLYDGIAHRQVDIEKERDLLESVLTLIPLADDSQSRRELRVTLGNLKGSIGSLVANKEYMRRHFDAVGVKPDRTDFAADLTPGARTSRPSQLSALHP